MEPLSILLNAVEDVDLIILKKNKNMNVLLHLEGHWIAHKNGQ